MLRLPDVSMVMVETRAHELLRITAEQFLAKVEPREVLIYTDRPELLAIPGARVELVPDWKDKRKLMEFFSYEAWRPATAPFIFYLEWDAGLCDVTMWRDEFLSTDYIGAIWWYQDGSPNVGNGGFSIRSRRLAEFQASVRSKWPSYHDNMLCRDRRKEFESAGFVWASEALANDFAFEGFDRLGFENNLKHFGYHSIHQAWPLLLDRDDLIRRTKLMVDNPYVCGYGRTDLILHAVPWLRTELGLTNATYQ